jgi:DNA gyrase subunit A
MQLRRLAALERSKIEEEHKQVKERIDHLEDLLAHPKKILTLIQTDLTELAEKYGDDRRTHIAVDATEEQRIEDMVQDEAVLISLTERGYIKRIAAKAFKSQSIGGVGVKGHTTKEEDEILFLVPARTLDTMLFFSDRGKVYSEKVYQIPDAERTGKGIPLVNVLALNSGERITAAIAVSDFSSHGYCIMMTAKGRIKRVILEEFASVRPSGLIAMSLARDDILGWARLTSGTDDLIIVTEMGQALRFSEKLVRPMGRTAAGVQGIRLGKDDQVTSMSPVQPGGSLLIVTSGGFGKQTPLSEYPAKGRATGGIATIDKKAIAIIGKITSARVVQQDDHLTLISANGVAIRLKVKDVKVSGRSTRGVRLMRLHAGDYVASVARVGTEDLKRVGAKVNGNGDEKKEDGQQQLL